MQRQENFAMNYVYNPGGSLELRSVKIEIEFNNSNGFLAFVVTSEDEIDKEDLEKILNELQEDRFNKIRLSIAHDCQVTLKSAGKEYSVELAATDAVPKQDVQRPAAMPKKGIQRPRSEPVMVITSVHPK